MDTDDKMRDALALHLDTPLSNIDLKAYRHYGLSVYSSGTQEWAIGTDGEVDDAMYEWTEANLFALPAYHISGPLNLYNETVEAIQEHVSEDHANEDLAILINEKDVMSDIVEKQDHGELATYDNEEVELESFGDTFYAFRLN